MKKKINFKFLVKDFVSLLGFYLIIRGLYMVYEPIAYIFLGVLLLCLAYKKHSEYSE